MQARSPRIPFSFSGLLSHTQRVIDAQIGQLDYTIGDSGVLPEAIRREVAKRFQEAAVEHLVRQVRRAMQAYTQRVQTDRKSTPPHAARVALQEDRPKLGELGRRLNGLVVSGGVASNAYLRDRYVLKHGSASRRRWSSDSGVLACSW